jgi:signal transduction histidine kinase
MADRVQTATSRARGRRLPIRTKLAAALTVPLVATAVMTIVEVLRASRDASEVRDQTELATATIGPNGLITALQDERNWAAAYLVGVESQLELANPGFEANRATVDNALAQFEAELDRRGDTARAAYEPALNGLAGITELRQQIDTAAANPDRGLDDIAVTTRYFDAYGALIEPFFEGMSRISIAMDDSDLRQGAELTVAVTRQMEIIPQMANALVFPATVPTAPGDTAGITAPSEIAEVARLRNAFNFEAGILQDATGRYAPIAEEHFPHEFTQVLQDQANLALSTGNIDVQVFLSGMDVGLDDAYLGYRDAVAGALTDRADELNDEAAARQQRFALLMVVTLGAATALTVIVSLSITRPLRSLTRQAKEMAERRLPGAVADILDTPLGEDVVVPTVAPVQVTTRDEVGDVAEALNKVQDSALGLAVEQAALRRNIADSFVNLGRRNQNLLARQMDFITQLETREPDPDRLASLFRLDHLATRMRRNAESLLVLAGTEPPRAWAAPVRLADVIRAALGEVEDYQRVAVNGIEPATVAGSAAADLAHLLAELVENALEFSPADRAVRVRSLARAPGGQPGGHALAIVDAGRGMPAHEIEAANRRLAGGESFTVAPSKYLGHYVTGNLAARHGIRVRLHGSPGQGVTAIVELPPTLFTTDEPHAPGGRLRGPRVLAAPHGRG